MPTQKLENKALNFESILRLAMESPGIKINRDKFLKKELSRYFDDDIVDKAIKTNPAQAGLTLKNLDRIASSCIDNETTKVTVISAAAGIPGGIAMAATVPADIIQFLGHVVRILQKLVYIYGWQEMFHGDDELDDGTVNELILFIGIMFGVNSANVMINKIARVVAKNAERILVKKALTKGIVYPIIKKISRIIGISMTKQIFANGVGKIIPIVGAVISGGVTFVGFRPMATRLKKYLITLPTASVEFYENKQNNGNGNDIIDIDFTDIVVDAI